MVGSELSDGKRLLMLIAPEQQRAASAAAAEADTPCRMESQILQLDDDIESTIGGRDVRQFCALLFPI
jgi:hypothetical protein